jgi:predicted kinase
MRDEGAESVTKEFFRPHPSSFILHPCLVVFSGPPGVGKSSLSYRLARHTGWALLARDQFDRTLQRMEIANWPPGGSYELLYDLASLNLQNGVSVILDAVFPKQGFRRRFTDLADCFGAQLKVIVCHCSDPELWRRRVETRPEMVSGWTPADWTEARRVQENYEAWNIPYLALDAVQSLDHNFNLILDFLR